MAALVAAVLLLSATAPARAAAIYPSTAETRAEFEAVCRRLTEGENAYFGRAAVAAWDRRPEASGGDTAATPLERARLAVDLVRLGRHQEALSLLDPLLATPGAAAGGGFLKGLYWLQGVAQLLLGEAQNCVGRHTAESCILPIGKGGVHSLADPARAAGDAFLRAFQQAPGDFQLRWLLNLARMLSGDYPEMVPPALRLPPDALEPEADLPRWVDLAPRLGVDAFDLSGGAIADDFDGDGLLDLVSSSWDPCEPMKAFRNDGHGGFEDVSEAWGLSSQLGGLNLLHADFDNDGRLDLLVLRGAWLGAEGRIRNSLLRNELSGPSGRFVDVTAAAGLAYPAFPTQAAGWADYDGDGDLDLYIGNEATSSSTDPLALTGLEGDPYPSQLFRNQGNGTFVDVARVAGVTNRRFAKGVAWGDYDDDGDPDLYVSNIGPNRLYRNNGDGTFTDVAEALGVTRPVKGSFPAWFFDYDNDGDLDLLVTSFNAPKEDVARSYFGEAVSGGNPALYRNDGGHFTEVAAAMGLWRPLLIMGSNYGDLDNDGWLDLYFGTGIPDYDALMPNVMYRNEGGRRFLDVTFAGGFGNLQKGHAVAFADLDNDGEQEIFQQLGGAFPYDRYGNALYENPGNDNRWIVLRLEGRRANRFALGGRIAVRVREAGGSERTVYSLVGAGGSFGGDSLQQEIGLGAAEAIEAITIDWPGSGTHQVFHGATLDRYYEAVEGADSLRPLDLPVIRLGAGPEAVGRTAPEP